MDQVFEELRRKLVGHQPACDTNAALAAAMNAPCTVAQVESLILSGSLGQDFADRAAKTGDLHLRDLADTGRWLKVTSDVIIIMPDTPDLSHRFAKLKREQFRVVQFSDNLRELID